MYKWKTDKETYLKFKTQLYELHPEIKVEIESCDDNLEKLGFVKSAPCVANIYLSREQRRYLLNELELMEMDSVDNEDIKCNERYERYGWLWDVLFYLEECEADRERGTLKEVPFWRDGMSVEEYELERTYFHEHWDDWTKGQYVPLWIKKRDIDPCRVRKFVFEIVKKRNVGCPVCGFVDENIANAKGKICYFNCKKCGFAVNINQR